ncbi:MAG: hypothetical protein ACFFC3_14705, partial [Candidatus Odinarchaeota archaeon]
MYRFAVYKISDLIWTKIISSAKQYDFYHTRSYSLLEGNNTPILCVCYHNKDFIAMPLLIREIEGTDMKDCTSVYGYCGPVSNVCINTLLKKHIQFFQDELISFFKENNIVTVFSRLHPILKQEPIFEN